jgi:hypothetical protein
MSSLIIVYQQPYAQCSVHACVSPALLCCAMLVAPAQAKENLELRMKYVDEPMKFLDNEVDLMSIIRGLAQVGRGEPDSSDRTAAPAAAAVCVAALYSKWHQPHHGPFTDGAAASSSRPPARGWCDLWLMSCCRVC